MKSSLVLLAVLLFIAIYISNNQDNSITQEKSIPESSEDDQYLLHAESSERLVNIMEQISSVSNSQNNEKESGFTEENIVDLVEAVEELLFYAELMSIKVPANKLEESKSVIFSAMANKLYDEALNIQQLTKTYDLEITDYSQENLINEAFNRLSQTCSACHELFRDN
ncbi:MAG: cytochrome c [Proteobacteria bacterium]|nr:hypothetical protein [Pseudomonadota bacterium]NOG59991.1 cytochrome c [Pseudomonadota bacterium]